MTDPLITAYIAMGASNVFRGLKDPLEADKIEHLVERYEGELRIIAEAISHAPKLEDAYMQYAGHGVFVYEVAEPFGEMYVRTLINGEMTDVDATVARLVARMADRHVAPSPTPTPTPAVVVIGRLSDGVASVVGPFTDLEAADNWAENNVDDNDFFTQELSPT